MGALSIPAPITVGEYEKIPDPPGGRYELHHGELVFMPFPVRDHWDSQRRVVRRLTLLYEKAGFIVGSEYCYRPLPENEVWAADVVCILEARHNAVNKWLKGSPELVIEVKSPSKTKAKLHDKAMTTLAGDGALEFWIVDNDAKAVTVY